MSNRYQGGVLTASYFPLQVPDAPTIGTATPAVTFVSVAFTAPSNVGGGAIISYQAVATDSSSGAKFIGTGASSPVTVSGLTTGNTYTVKVSATNAFGSGPLSAASNSATTAPLPTNFILQLDGANWNGTTWTATVGTNPTKNGTISANTTNGFPCALFGSGGYFTIPSFVAPSSLSVFAVLNESSGVPLIVEQSTNANSQNGFYYYTDNTYPYAVYRSSVGTRLDFTAAGGDWFLTGFGMGATNFTGSAFTLRRNSTDIATTNSGNVSSYASSSNTTDTLYIGSRAGSSIFFNGGSLCELIIAPSLSNTDFNIVSNYLVAKYGL